RRATQQAGAGRVPEGGLDVPGAQSPRVHLDGEPLELGRPPGEPGAHAGHERLGAIRDLGHAVLDGALGRAQPAAAIPVSVARAGRRAGFVVASPDDFGHFGLQRFLHDLPHGQLEQLGAGLAVGYALGQQLTELLACPFGCRYSRLHGDASSCRRCHPATLGLGSKQECIPVSLSSKSRTSPMNLVVRFAAWARSDDRFTSLTVFSEGTVLPDEMDQYKSFERQHAVAIVIAGGYQLSKLNGRVPPTGIN